MIPIKQSNIQNYSKIHANAIAAYCKSDKPTKFKYQLLNKAVKKYFGHIVESFEGLLASDVDKLNRLKKHFDSRYKPTKKKIRRELNLVGLFNEFKKNNSTYIFNGHIVNSSTNAAFLNVPTCPYCNENYTYSYINESTEKISRTFDWDHFYPKGKYRFLAISFYNLVPSCKICNGIKNETTGDFLNPFADYKINNLLYFSVLFSKPYNILDKDCINILPVIPGSNDIDQKLKANLTSVSIKSRYNQRKDVASNILQKKSIYSDAYLEKFHESFGIQMNLSIKVFRDLIYNVWLTEEDFNKAPFSKLTYDLVERDTV